MTSTATNVAGSTRIVAAVREPGWEDRIGPPERRLELLARGLAFAHLPAPVLEELASRLTEERFHSGDTVVVEDGLGDRLYLIMEGRAEASTTASYVDEPVAFLVLL